MKHKYPEYITATSDISLDEIKEQLISQLTTEQVVSFFIEVLDDTFDPEEAYYITKLKVDKIAKEYES